MKRIRLNYHLLQALENASPRLRKAILENSNRDLVLGIAEFALNVINGNCKISKSGVDQLRKHKTVRRRLVDSGVALHTKKLTVQRGGFLLPLLTAALSALPSLIQLKKKCCGKCCSCRTNIFNGYDAVMVMTSTWKLITRGETCVGC
jgi:hypothetical protein